MKCGFIYFLFKKLRIAERQLLFRVGCVEIGTRIIVLRACAIQASFQIIFLHNFYFALVFHGGAHQMPHKVTLQTLYVLVIDLQRHRRTISTRTTTTTKQQQSIEYVRILKKLTLSCFECNAKT